jgi:methylated-DNA-[protein]-cysteine S-methyltransferase
MDTAKHTYIVFETAYGHCAIAWNETGVTRFQLPSQHAATTERNLVRRTPGAAVGVPTPEIDDVIAIVKRYYDGETIDFSHIRVDLGEMNEFSKRIYKTLRHIAWGQTTTYGALAKELGLDNWEGARDVGQAMGKNQIPLIIPCHRVLAAGGKIGGFSAPGGAETKMRMLELEGVKTGPAQPAQGTLSL